MKNFESAYSSTSTESIESASFPKFTVALRVRPPNWKEIHKRRKIVVKVLDQNTIIFDPQEYKYQTSGLDVNLSKCREKQRGQCANVTFKCHRVFGANSSNWEVFEDLIKENIEPLIHGNNFFLFCYGATGTGKTHTMFGKPNQPGIVYLTIEEIFKAIESSGKGNTYEFFAAYLEVYNNKIFDLLNLCPKLTTSDQGVDSRCISGLYHVRIQSAEDLKKLIKRGNKHRKMFPTVSNVESSRSHAIVQIQIRITDELGNAKLAKLSITDLAGSECIATCGLEGSRYEEALNINRNLLALGNCIHHLADGTKFIPYRDSKLTRLLKDTLGGEGKSVMISTIAPTEDNYNDTICTLKYSNLAQRIKIRSKDLNSEPVTDCMRRFKKIDKTLKNIENRVAQCNLCNKESTSPFSIILPLINAILLQKSSILSCLTRYGK